MGRRYLSFDIETTLSFSEILRVIVTGVIPEGHSRKMELLYDLSQLTDQDVSSISLEFKKSKTDKKSGTVTATVHFTTEDRRIAIEQILRKLK